MNLKSTDSRISQAEKDLKAIEGIQSFQGRVIKSGLNISIPQSTEEVLEDISPVKIRIVSHGLQDDDLMLQIGDVKIFDTRLRATQYFGEETGPIGFNPNFRTEGFRIASVDRSTAIALGANWEYATKVEVFGANVRATGWQVSPWTAEITWPNGIVTRRGGGAYDSGSEGINSQQIFDPPIYHENGSFLLTN